MLKLSLDKDYKAAIYLRLSKEDGDFSVSGEKLESDSISNQRIPQEAPGDYRSKRILR